MEQPEENKDCGGGSGKSLTPSKDDSLTDFKSPKLETAVPIKPRIIIERRPKKSSSKGKTAGKKKKETVAKEVAQPSIESSFFKAAVNGKRDGHTCPLCMKYFADTSTGTSHTKNCASKNKVSTKKLLAAVALQERQANERVALGLPAGPIVQPKEKTARRPREAGAKGDPDLQLALALSKSLQENQLEQEFEEALLLASEHRGEEPIVGFSSDHEKRKTLTNFGFLTNKPAGVLEVPGRTRRKKHLGPTILQTRSQEARDRLLTDKVAEILMGNEAITQVCRQEASVEVEPVKKRRITLRSRLLREIHRTTKRVWDIAQMSTIITDFYVENLAPVIVPVDSQKQENSENIAGDRNNDEKNAENKIDGSAAPSDESPLEEDDKQTEKMSVSSEEREKVNEVTNDCLKIPSPSNIRITDRQYRNTLPMDWTDTLNVSSMSDVVVLVKNGHIWAHKLVFFVRCSNILLDCEENNDTNFPHVREQISWSDVDLSTGLAFLEFVYSGLIEKNTKLFSDNNVAVGVRRLARKYKVKALFDYLRKKQADFDRLNIVSEEIESHKFGLCSPVVIEVRKVPSNFESFDENSPANEEHKDAEEVEGRKSGLCSPIVIEVEGTPSDVETVKENLPTDEERKGAKEDHESSQSSLTRDNDEISSGGTNILMQKTADNKSESRNNDAMSVISITSSRSRVSMSPDLFDETTEEASVDTVKNSEQVEEKADLSGDENSNLKILAELIARNDLSSSREASQQSPASIIMQDKMAEKSRSFHETSDFDSSKQHTETPRSRSSSALEIDTKIKDKPRSQLFPDKQKSNLSLFIAKIQKMNAKGPLDSYTEEESLAVPNALIRRRNPFNINNTDDKSIADSTEKIQNNLGRGKNGKRGLSVFEEPINPINSKNVNPEVKTTAEDTADANDNAHAEESYLADDTFNTEDEDISMYSKYRKTHMHNNSINKYKNILKKLDYATVPVDDDDKNDNIMAPDEKPIDLTQESDSDADISHSRISDTSPLNKQKIVDNTSDNDSIHSAATAIVHHHNLHELSDDENSKNAETEKMTSLDSANDRQNNDDKTKRNIYSKMSDASCEESSDSEDASTESALGKKNTNKGKTNVIRPSQDFKKTEQNVPQYSLEISPESVEKTTRHSSRDSNHDLLEGDEEIFVGSWKSKTPSPSTSSASHRDKILSSGCKEKTKKAKTNNRNLVDYSHKDEENVPHYSIDSSPESAKSLRKSPQHFNHDLLEGDTEIFAHSWKSKTPSPSKNSTGSPDEILSLSRKEMTKKIKTKSVSSANDSNKTQQNVPEYSIDISPESVKSSKKSPRYSNHELLEVDEEIFARSWKSRTPSPFPNSSALASGTFSSGRKRKSEEIRNEHGSFNKNLHDEELRVAKKSSNGAQSPRNSPEYSDLDVFEINEEMFAQTFKKARVSQKCPSPSQKRSFDYSDNSVTSRRKRRAEEKKAKETSFVKDLESKNVTDSTDYPDIDVDELISQNLREAIESPKKSSFSRSKKNNNEESRKTPEISLDFEENQSNKSSEATKNLRNSPDHHYDVYEPDDHVLTQSFNSRWQSPCRSPSPNCASDSKNNDHRSTLKVPSPILITSSPEFDMDTEINFSDPKPDAFISNKENLFTNDRKHSFSTRKSYDNLAEGLSPTNFESSQRFLGHDFEKLVGKNYTSNLESPTSPQPSTSCKFSGNRKVSASSAKNPLLRWNSMPTTSNIQVGKKRSRTPTQSSRLVMSQDVTPKVNYDMMDTPELQKELSKYGIKPQPRIRARKLLTHIYNELHPLAATSPEGTDSSDHIASSDDDKPPAKKINKISNRISEESDSDRELPLSQESATSAANAIPEEMDFDDGNASSDDGEKSSTSNIKKAFKALLKEDKEIHNKVLTYEPLPLELLHLMLQSGGLKCQLKDLMDFLDEECITFQVQSQRNNNRGRGKKNARGRKAIASTQKS